MDINVLKRFLTIANHENLQRSAAVLNTTPSALSKSLQKLELELNTLLFERRGKQLKLNDQGKHFLGYAQHLVHEYDQVLSEFKGQQYIHNLSVAGPAILTNYVLAKLHLFAPIERFHTSIFNCYEGEALNKLRTGHADVAIVTKNALSKQDSKWLSSIFLTKCDFSIGCSSQFKAKFNAKPFSQWPFACPTVSPFCGIERGTGNDNWPDKNTMRTIAFKADQFASLLHLVKHHLACAYLPSYVINQEQLQTMPSPQFDHTYDEEMLLCWQPSLASGWLNQLTHEVQGVFS